MRISIRTKQVLGVSALVGAVVVGLSVHSLSQLADVRLVESRSRGKLLARVIYQRARSVVPGALDVRAALRDDRGLRDILQASIYSENVTDAAIVDLSGVVVAHYDPERVGKPQPDAAPLDALVALSGLQQLRTIFVEEGRTYEIREPLELNNEDFGTIRIGISTLLVRNELEDHLGPVLRTAIWVLVGAVAVALLLAQWLLRPIHVLRTGLKKLERGERAQIDLPQDELGDLGREIHAVSEKLLADRAAVTGPQAGLDSIVEHLADAVGIFGPGGELLFANPPLRGLMTAHDLDGRRPVEDLVRRTLQARTSAEPLTVTLRSDEGEVGAREWQVLAHPVEDRRKRLLGVMVVARDLATLGEVESTLRYSRKLAALGRLTAGVAHEVKNPLNAMTIHLELLKSKLHAPAGVLAGAGRGAENGSINTGAILEHVGVIGTEIKRLDQVVQGFLKFMRPEDLQLQPVNMTALLEGIARVVQPDAAAANIRVVCECPSDIPPVHGDPNALRQALMNLAINACQAMPNGGILRLTGRSAGQRRIAITVEDTGIGIAPEHLPKIFDLYFTTKQGGSGIGLSMVFRSVQLHDGEVEVRSTPGVGTTFRITLPQASGGSSVLGLR